MKQRLILAEPGLMLEMFEVAFNGTEPVATRRRQRILAWLWTGDGLRAVGIGGVVPIPEPDPDAGVWRGGFVVSADDWTTYSETPDSGCGISAAARASDARPMLDVADAAGRPPPAPV